MSALSHVHAMPDSLCLSKRVSLHVLVCTHKRPDELYRKAHTFSDPLAGVSLSQVLGEDQRPQRVAGSKQRRIWEALLDLLHRKVGVVCEGCRVCPGAGQRQPCTPSSLAGAISNK